MGLVRTSAAAFDAASAIFCAGPAIINALSALVSAGSAIFGAGPAAFSNGGAYVQRCIGSTVSRRRPFRVLSSPAWQPEGYEMLVRFATALC